MRRILVLTFMIVLSGCTMDLSHFLLVNAPKPVPVTDTVLVGDVTRGADIFKHGVGDAPPCSSCHTIGQSAFSLGPKLAGISQRAGQRVPGLTADDYIRQSILEPSAYVVSGFRDIMYPLFKEKLSDQNVADLIAYLKTL